MRATPWRLWQSQDVKRPRFPVTTEWRETVLATMERQGMTQVELARKIKATQPSVSRALTGEAVYSTLIPAINKALGIQDAENAALQEWMLLYDRLSSDDRKHVLALINSLLNKKP